MRYFEKQALSPDTLKIMEKAALSNNKILQALESRGYELMARNKHIDKLLNLADKLKNMDHRTSGILDVMQDISDTAVINLNRNNKTINTLKSIKSKKIDVLASDRGRQFVDNQLNPVIESIGKTSDRIKKLNNELSSRMTRVN